MAKSILLLGSLAAATGLWGGLTALSAFATRLWMLFVLRALTGVALAAVMPVGQSMVADMAGERRRGKLYGLMGAAGWYA